MTVIKKQCFALSFLAAKVRKEIRWRGERKENQNNGQNLLSAHSVPGIKSFMCGNKVTI